MSEILVKLQDFFTFITSAQLQDEFILVKPFFIFFASVFFISIIYFYIKSSYLMNNVFFNLSSFLNQKPYAINRVTKRWEGIEGRIKTNSESEYKLAIIEADNFFSEVLERQGFAGKTFEEKAKQLEDIKTTEIGEVLEAHKIRNSVMYDPDFKLDINKAKKILSTYEKTIKDIESF